MTATNSIEAEQAVKGGATAGVIGGVVLAAFLTVMCFIKGLDVWQNVFKGTAAPFYGDRALQAGFDLAPVLVGALCHFAIAIAWGMLFGLLAYGLSKTMTLVASLVYGVVVWLGMFYVVMPLAGLGEMAREVPTVDAIVMHLVFGLGVGVGFLPFQRRHVTTPTAHPHEPAHMPV